MIVLLTIILKEVDIIYMLRDWQDSTGATIEKMFAERCGKQILYE